MRMGVAGIIISDYGLASVKRYWESQFVRYGHMVKHVDHPLDSGMSWVSPGSRKTHWLMLAEYQKTTNFVVIYSIIQCYS